MKLGGYMELIRYYWAKFKNTKLYKWYKGLPVSVVGVTALLAIIGFLTIIFNWYWSGLGEDSSRHFILPLTKDGDEFIQYTTLYIYLITFGATLFAGLAVFLVFNDWKDQHNAKLCSDIAQRIWKNLDLVSTSTEDPSRKFNRIWEISNEEFNNLKPYMINVMSKLKHTVIEIESDLKLLDDLLEKDISSNLNSTFKNFTYDETKESIDIFQKLQEEYEILFLPYQRNVKKLLIPIIKA